MDRGTVFFPDPYLIGTPADLGLAFEEVWLEAEDAVRLHGWFVPGPETSDHKELLFLWFHGNAGNISHRLENLALLHQKVGCSIFIFDYREYGLSQGEVSKAGTFLDAEAAYRWACQKSKAGSEGLILFGRSLGSALAVHLAVRQPCLGVILEAAFTSSEEMRALYGPFLPPVEPGAVVYDSMGQIERLRAPVLFIHGSSDLIIPPAMGLALYEKAPEPKRFYLVEAAGHNDTYLTGGEAYFNVIRDFLSQCRRASS
jgi:hypothetical protein